MGVVVNLSAFAKAKKDKEAQEKKLQDVGFTHEMLGGLMLSCTFDMDEVTKSLGIAPLPPIPRTPLNSTLANNASEKSSATMHG